MKKIKIKEEEILNELIKIIYSDLIKKNYISKKYCNTDLISNDLSKSSEIKEKMKEMLDIVNKAIEDSYCNITLDDILDIRDTKPNNYSLNGKIDTNEVNNWKDFYIKILKKLDKKYNDKLKKLVDEKKLNKILFLNREEVLEKHKTKINGIYYSTNFSANDFLYNLKDLFKELGIDFKNLEIEYSHKKGK